MPMITIRNFAFVVLSCLVIFISILIFCPKGGRAEAPMNKDLPQYYAYNIKGNLPHFKAALENISSQDAIIITCGDSITNGFYATNLYDYSWPARLRDLFRNVYGNCGDGMTVYADERFFYKGSVKNEGGVGGPGEHNVQLIDPGSAVSATLTCTDVDVLLTTYPSVSGYDASVTVDGTVIDTFATWLNPCITPLIKSYHLSDTPQSHTITVTSISGATLFCEFNPRNITTNGVLVQNIAVSGSSTSNFATDTFNYFSRQDLVFLCWGVNDFTTEGFSVWKSNMTNFVSYLKENGNCDIIVLGTYWSDQRTWPTFVEEMKQFALQNDLPFIDMNACFNAYPGGPQNVLLSDGINKGSVGSNGHPSTAGDDYIAQMVYKALMASVPSSPAVRVNAPAIAGVTAPVLGATPVSTIAATSEYTATISWAPTASAFTFSKVYTAIIAITPKTGYTLAGVPANYFTVAGATATNDAGSGIVTAVFPETAGYYVYGPDPC